LRPLVAIVALGNRLAFDQNLGIGKASSLDVATQEALQILNLDEAAFARHREVALEAVEKDKTLIAEF
ncbi:MAG: hypothetical protein LWX11_11915, partial [Firmicutes bacterium]|nr:hypothetical protein [Bacillota bacterium]